jgi:hypothetical protein
LYYAFKAGSNAVFVFGSDLVGELVSEHSAKGIFDYSKWDYQLPRSRIPIMNYINKKLFYYPSVFLDNIDAAHSFIYKFGGVVKDTEIAKKLQNYEWDESPHVVVTGVPVDIVLDGDHWTIPKSPQRKAIIESAMLWNEMNPTDQIHGLSKYQKYLLQGKIMCPEGVTPTMVIPWVRILTAFPLSIQENVWGGDRRQTAEDLFNDESGNLNKYLLPCLFGGLGIAFMIICVRLLIHYTG